MTKITRDYFQTLNRPQTEYLTFEYATFETDVLVAQTQTEAGFLPRLPQNGAERAGIRLGLGL